ncbi:MAG: TetR/AcrR family transcriptional regulator [Acidimicrobiales bacterium]
MMQGRKHRTTGARRQAILKAALECFLAKGYEATTMAEVSQASGASIGSLYHHYGAKESIAVALYSDALDSYCRSWLAVLEATPETEEAVRAAVHNHFSWLGDNQSTATVLFGHPVPGALARRHPEVAVVQGAFNDELMAWIRPRVGRGGMAHKPDDVYQPLWLGPAQELTRSLIGYDRLGDLGAVAPELADGAWAALKWS